MKFQIIFFILFFQKSSKQSVQVEVLYRNIITVPQLRTPDFIARSVCVRHLEKVALRQVILLTPQLHLSATTLPSLHMDSFIALVLAVGPISGCTYC